MSNWIHKWWPFLFASTFAYFTIYAVQIQTGYNNYWVLPHQIDTSYVAQVTFAFGLLEIIRREFLLSSSAFLLVSLAVAAATFYFWQIRLVRLWAISTFFVFLIALVWLLPGAGYTAASQKDNFLVAQDDCGLGAGKYILPLEITEPVLYLIHIDENNVRQPGYILRPTSEMRCTFNREIVLIKK